jgi:phosphate:Na+ symporter
MLCFFNKFTGMITHIVAKDGILRPEETPIAMSLFHTVFNITNVLLLIGFVPVLVKIVEKMVPLKDDEEEDFRLKYINRGLMGTPELSIIQAKREAQFFAKHTSKMFDFFKSLIVETNEKKFNDIYAKIVKYESISDNVEVEITNYLSQLSQHRMSETARRKVRAMIKISGDLESVADCVFNLARSVNRMHDKKIKFSEKAMEKLENMFSIVNEALEIMKKNLLLEETEVQLDMVNEIEDRINNYRDHLKATHFDNLENNVYSYEEGIIFNDIFCECEKLGDYTINVSEALDEVKALSNK